VANLKNHGREWRRSARPDLVDIHDFIDSKPVPYGVYHTSSNAGWVSVGTDHDNPALRSIDAPLVANHWKQMPSQSPG
jgi:hypothetical protein